MADRLQYIADQIEQLKRDGLYGTPPVLEGAQGAELVVGGKPMLNFCSNNYLGLANHPALVSAAKAALDSHGLGPGAVRTIAGTMDLHLALEQKLAAFKRAQAVVTFQSGFCANLAVVPAVAGTEQDAIISDELNHASIIDGVRLSKADRYVYKHCDMSDLEARLRETAARNYRAVLLITDGVFSMDGDIAPLPRIVDLAEKYGAITMVDDAHGEGVLGKAGRGIVDHFGLHGRVDIEVGTMSKAFGVMGGLVAGNAIIVDWLRQRGRPFLFSSAMTVPDVAGNIAAVDLLAQSGELVERLWDNARFFQSEMRELGFDIGRTETPITPVMLGEAKVAQEFSRRLREAGILATAIGYPTVPLGRARIRVMVSAAHTRSHLTQCVAAFSQVRSIIGL